MITFAESVDIWEETRKALGTVQPYTAKKSAAKARTFLPFFGDEDVDEITAADVETAIAILRTDGGRHGQGLSGTSLRSAHLAARQAIDYAINHGRATTNAFRKVPRPKADRSKARSLEREQFEELATFARNELSENMERGRLGRAAFCVAVLIAMGTGMRRGEIFGLEWPDYDGHTISVRRSVKPDGIIGEPKTQSGIRRIAIGSSTAKVLDQFKEFQAPLVPKRRWDEAAPVMADGKGGRLSMNTFEHWWATFRKRAGYDGLKFHELRHTHASLLIANGTDVKTVQGRLGHSSADITMNIYAHALPRNDATAAQAIDGMLGGSE